MIYLYVSFFVVQVTNRSISKLTGSGQSPNSIQPGSPPAITAPPPAILTNKRPGYYQGNDGLPTKKPRISHYRKSEANSSSSNAGVSGRTTSGNSGSGVSPTAGSTLGNSASGSGGNSSGSSSVVSNWDHRQQHRERRGDCRLERTTNSDVTRSGNAATATSSKSCQASPSDSANNQSGYRRDGNVVTTSVNAGNNSLIAIPGSHNPHNSPAYNNSVRGGGGGNGNGNDRYYHASRSATVVSGDNSACSAGVDNATRFNPSSARSDSGVNINNISIGGTVSSGSSSNNADRRNKSDSRSRTGAREERDLELWARSSASSYNDNTASAPNRDLPKIAASPMSPPVSESLLALGSPVALLENSQVPDYLM